MAKNPPETMGELQKLLKVFEAKTRIHVNVTIFPWSTAWSTISRYASIENGPDVSEVGTSWVTDLVEKNTLAHFSESDMARLGGETNFYPQVWETCKVYGDETIWAVPWITETRMLYYRRDILEKAGINPGTAFKSSEAFEKTLATIQASGITQQPWSVTSRRAMNTLHYTCSWIWGAGGDYCSPDGKKWTLTHPQTIKGLCAYYALKQYLGPFASRMSDLLATSTFWGGQSAVTIDGQWALAVQRRTASPDVVDHVGLTLVPGASYIGGSNLVIWKTCKEPHAAMELINFLNSTEVVLTFQKYTGHLPARKDIFRSSITEEDVPFKGVFEQALQTGRSFPNVAHWGRLENKMVEVLGLIWEDWLNSTSNNIADIVSQRIGQLQESVEAGLY